MIVKLNVIENTNNFNNNKNLKIVFRSDEGKIYLPNKYKQANIEIMEHLEIGQKIEAVVRKDETTFGIVDIIPILDLVDKGENGCGLFLYDKLIIPVENKTDPVALNKIIAFSNLLGVDISDKIKTFLENNTTEIIKYKITFDVEKYTAPKSIKIERTLNMEEGEYYIDSSTHKYIYRNAILYKSNHPFIFTEHLKENLKKYIKEKYSIEKDITNLYIKILNEIKKANKMTKALIYDNDILVEIKMVILDNVYECLNFEKE